jgi:hypothetical protein
VNTADSVNGIAAWLGVQLKTGSVSARGDFDREATVFRISLNDGTKIGELEISQEALDEHAPENIIADLQKQDVPSRLKRDPTMRLAYTVDRDVPHLETRITTCGGRLYRFVRDSGHAVRVYDSTDRILERMPSPLPVLKVSLFKRAPQQLCDDVRGWRGPDQ